VPDTPNKPEKYYDDKSDMRKSIRKQYKSKRKKEKEILDTLVNDKEEDIEEYYDNFEKW
jgi:hypothetical protein